MELGRCSPAGPLPRFLEHGRDEAKKKTKKKREHGSKTTKKTITARSMDRPNRAECGMRAPDTGQLQLKSLKKKKHLRSQKGEKYSRNSAVEENTTSDWLEVT